MCQKFIGSASFCFVLKAVHCRRTFPLSQNRNLLFTVLSFLLLFIGSVCQWYAAVLQLCTGLILLPSIAISSKTEWECTCGFTGSVYLLLVFTSGRLLVSTVPSGLLCPVPYKPCSRQKEGPPLGLLGKGEIRGRRDSRCLIHQLSAPGWWHLD